MCVCVCVDTRTYTLDSKCINWKRKGGPGYETSRTTVRVCLCVCMQIYTL